MKQNKALLPVLIIAGIATLMAIIIAITNNDYVQDYSNCAKFRYASQFKCDKAYY